MSIKTFAVFQISVVTAVLAVAPAARGELIVTAHSIGGGLYEYDLTIVNRLFINPETGRSETISGLNLIGANTVFGLDASSFITAPKNVNGIPMADWDFFAPLPPVADELNYFSLTEAADIAIGGILSGYTFLSSTDPGTVDLSRLEFDVLGGESGAQLVMVPEPTAVVQATIACLVLTRFLASRRKLMTYAHSHHTPPGVPRDS
ncbi:hypothetical protein [Paludisphaera mucosa]|uniref:PEP-CTERM protein-sorting domain-containing protein n=1 Tax=Paludisphaera mucosa TaxID=3030827 RepID=A0ABT6FLV0_9BACT|nr:hypothetical protein [Paludisphaera mucosa]MDG3008353.1 hypothetical protein [Paludisphaera mucosa]